MAIEMRQQMKLSQQLVMTPQLQQAIKLLQLSRIELQDVVRQELEENPILDEAPEMEENRETEHLELQEKESSPAAESEEFKEVQAGTDTLSEMDWDHYLEGYNFSVGEQYRDDDDERSSYENILTKKGTLSDHLMWQLNMTRLTEQEVVVGAELIGNIDEDGYLRASLAEIATATNLEESFDRKCPGKDPGIRSCRRSGRDLRESLLIQVRHLGMGGTLVEAILLKHLKDLELRRYKPIARAEGVEVDDILMAAKIIQDSIPNQAGFLLKMIFSTYLQTFSCTSSLMITLWC